jgi:hypothetical protein
MRLFENSTYRRINHPTKFEKWWDSLPTWVYTVFDILKVLIAILVLAVFLYR